MPRQQTRTKQKKATKSGFHAFRPGKKGIMFTILALLLSAFMIVMFSPMYKMDSSSEREFIAARVNQMNKIVEEYPRFASLSAELSAYDTIESLNTLIVNKGLVIECDKDIITDYFSKCMTDGSFESGGDKYTCYTDDYPEGIKTLNEQVEEVTAIAEEITNTEMAFSIDDISLRQETPWVITMTATLTYGVKGKYSSWIGTKEINTNLFVENLPDPLQSYQKREMAITKTGISEWTGDISQLEDFIEKRDYRYFPTAPSYMARLCNSSRYKASSEFHAVEDCCGIESFIPENDFELISPNYNISFIDYDFYNQTKFRCNATLFMLDVTVGGINMKVPIDNEHLVSFKIPSTEWEIEDCLP